MVGQLPYSSPLPVEPPPACLSSSCNRYKFVAILCALASTAVFSSYFMEPDIKRTHPIVQLQSAISDPPSSETCAEWIQTQRATKSYLDAYVIGAQKAGTSELTKRLHRLGVRRNGDVMKKEWHFFDKLPPMGEFDPNKPGNQLFTVPLHITNISALRRNHYMAGHPALNLGPGAPLPLVDDSPIDTRQITYDSTVEYLHSSRAANLSHLLTPNARILVLLRHPIERAISQYNMNMFKYNAKLKLSGEDKFVDSREDFHRLIEEEVTALERCGYNFKTASYEGTTNELSVCVTEHSNNRLQIVRGLYALHIRAWREYFPEHRFHFVSFDEAVQHPREMLGKVTRFLCVRDFPEELLDQFQKTARNVSFGMATAMYGEKAVQDNYGSDDGQVPYMTDILETTRRTLEEVFAGSDQEVERMLGKRFY